MQPRQLFQAVATEPLERSGKQYAPGTVSVRDARAYYQLVHDAGVGSKWARKAAASALSANNSPTPDRKVAISGVNSNANAKMMVYNLR
jgi:hypothetical protein